MDIKTIIITDPSYILTEDEYSYLGNLSLDQKDISFSGFADTFAGEVEKFLQDKLGFEDAMVAYIGCGSWSNTLHSASKKVDIIQSDFDSHTGLVVVSTYHPKMKTLLEEMPPFCYSIADVPEDTIYTIDRKNKDWTVILLSSPEKFLYAKTSETSDSDF